jgi:hypothetical protein
MAEHHVMMEERSIAIDERILKNKQEQKARVHETKRP